ncbi:MAG TPA: branched-chain amino acid ABC transporter permease [Actinocrinis sp.]|nr:branched-chain amino acid ABC transporter permease [Actinocrinis sp.]
MSTVVLLTATGLGLAALYFLVASGLSLIFGLMDVLDFAHGAFVAIGGYVAWTVASHLAGTVGLLLAALAAIAAGAAVAAATELAIIRPLYARPLDQVLATVGLGLAIPALLQAIWGADPRPWPALPDGLSGTVGLLGARIPADRLLLIGAAAALLAALRLPLTRTRAGLVVRAGVEDRDMVAALGVDVGKAFTGVFALGGAAAGLAGALDGVYQGSMSPGDGTSLLVFAFVVVVLGRTGSLAGTAAASVAVGLVQQFANYVSPNLGDESVVILLAAVLLLRRRDLKGRPA